MSSGSLSQQVIEAIAVAEDVEPAEVPAPLADVVDPDALNSLFRNSTGAVTFTYHDYEVTVDDSGHVAVMPILNTNHSESKAPDPHPPEQ